MNLLGRHLISTQEWAKTDLQRVVELAGTMANDRYAPKYAQLNYKTFFMLFYNPSVRTRQSFECATTELGGHAQFLEPRSMRLHTHQTAGETIEDLARVMSAYGAGVGIRILEDQVPYYGAGDELIRQFASYSKVPVISMAHDKYHPCQALADLMALQRRFDHQIQNKKLLLTWAKGSLVRSHGSVQDSLQILSRFGMDITIAHPVGYELDEEVIGLVKQNCEANGNQCRIINDAVEGYRNVDVVYSRNWMSATAYQGAKVQKEAEIKKANLHQDWICNREKMQLTNNALFMHPMPIDRGSEVTNDVASGPNSIIYEIAENRLHVQKSILALTMGKGDF